MRSSVPELPAYEATKRCIQDWISSWPSDVHTQSSRSICSTNPNTALSASVLLRNLSSVGYPSRSLSFAVCALVRRYLRKSSYALGSLISGSSQVAGDGEYHCDHYPDTWIFTQAGDIRSCLIGSIWNRHGHFFVIQACYVSVIHRGSDSKAADKVNSTTAERRSMRYGVAL